MFQTLAQTIDGSALNKIALDLLSNVPGFPPIIQTVHLMSIAAIMGSIVLIDLKVLGLALPSQATSELVRRLMPWTWFALPVLATSGLVFILARPYRYFGNPIFGAKIAMVVPAFALAAIIHRLNAKNPGFWDGSRGQRVSARMIAGLSLLLWIGIVLAGRWIAYVDYFFPE